ncbi:MAG TPA: MFS transporter [Chthoniobacterales bacterium]|nr:MFS transporter [Chthoniobacterales bacterium]
MPDRKPHAPPPPYEAARAERSTTAEGILEPRPEKHDPYAAFRISAFRFYTAGNLISVVGRLMFIVAVEWEMYRHTHSATALGLIGLVIALPVVLLSLPAGHIADRFPRKRIVLVTQALSSVCSLALAFVSWNHLRIPNWAALRSGNHFLYSVATVFERHTYFQFDDLSIPLIYLILLISATGRTFGWAARSSYFPQLVPREVFANAVTWNSSVFQIGSVIGPALGGLLIVRAGFPFIYALDAACAFSFFLLVLPIRSSDRGSSSERNAWRSLKEGIRFILHKQVVLATITLDMFAVLLGGATALLPIFADQILHCGPIGLGWMRAAPGIGAFIMALLIAYSPPMKNAGKTLLWCVTGFGLATIVFGLSNYLWLSLAMLFLTGVFDSVSVVIRHTLLQLVTPDSMRGRISAVNNIFIGTSNELGTLESGLTGAFFGPVLSVVGGGIGTILVVLGVCWKWPETRKIGALDKNLR